MNDAKVNKIWFAEYNRAENEVRGLDPKVIHKHALKCAHEKRRKYLRENHGKSD